MVNKFYTKLKEAFEKVFIDSGKKDEVELNRKIRSKLHFVVGHSNVLGVITDNIADNPKNYTRFLVLSKKKAQESQKDKTSIIFSIKHEPGALHHIIKMIYEYEINLTKIESRPKKSTPWEYNFYVDFEGHENNSKVKEMLDKIKEKTTFLKILGSYPSAELS